MEKLTEAQSRLIERAKRKMQTSIFIGSFLVAINDKGQTTVAYIVQHDGQLYQAFPYGYQRITAH